MRVVVFGARGFIGSNVVEALKAEHEVFPAYRGAEGEGQYAVDLTEPDSVAAVLRKTRPDAVINCAGMVNNNETARLNSVFTGNILQEIINTGLDMRRIITFGSASEYGVVEDSGVPIKEDAPLRASQPYGISKVEEVSLALKYRHEADLPVVVARIFNPIGVGMPERQLIPRILGQIAKMKVEGVEPLQGITRLDSKRDYINVRDVARALEVLLTADTRHEIYNVGSGKATSNGDLIELILRHSGLPARPSITETLSQPESTVPSRADISRLRQLGWEPRYSIEKTIKEIMDASGY